MLVIDVSGSMQAKDVKPTRLEAAQNVVRDFMKGLPKQFQVGVVSFSETAEVAAPATADRQLAIDAIDYLYPQRGTAIGDGLARGVEVARAAEAGRGRRGHVLPRSCCSRTARRPRACSSRSREPRGRSPSRSPSTRSRSARLKASSSSTASAARGSFPCRPTSRRCGRSPRRRAAASTRPRASATCATAYDKMGSLVSKVKRKQEVTFVFLGRRTRAPARRGRDRGRDVPEAAVRYLLAVFAARSARRLQRGRQGSRAGLDGRADGHRHGAEPRPRRPPRRRRIAPARSPTPSRASSRRSSTCAPRPSAAGGARARGSCSTGAGSSSRTTTSSRARHA